MSAVAFLRRMTMGHVARGSLVSLTVRLIGITLSFAQGVLTARLLGPSGYGIVAFAISIAQVGATVAQLGLGSLAVRTISQRLGAGDVEGVRRFLRGALTAVGALSVLSSAPPLAIVLFGWGAPSELESALLLSAVAIAPLSVLLLLRGIAQGLGNVALAQWPGEVLRPGLLVAALGAAAVLGTTLGPIAFLGAVIATAFVAALVALVAICSAVGALSSNGAGTLTKRLPLTEALPFLGIGLIAILQSEMATLMLGSLASPEEAGLYQPVARLVPLIALPMNAAAMSYTPRFSELWQRGEQQRARRLTHTFTLTTFAASLLIFVAIIVFAPAILWLFGPEFAAATPMLRIYAAGLLFAAACGPAGAVVTMIGRARDALAALCAGVFLQGALGLLLIPAHGAYGATISITAGTGLTWTLMLVAARKTGGFDPSLITAAARLRAARRYLTESGHA